MFLAPASAAAHTPDLDYACDPDPADCTGWFQTAVELRWDWNSLDADPKPGSQCGTSTISADTNGTRIECEIVATDGHETGHAVTIRVDKTAPSISIAPTRGPDFGDWFNRPVEWAATGSDGTSGIASCSSGTYAGPDGAGVSVTGTCTDDAGNVSAGSFSINYDATAPAGPDVEAVPGNHLVRVRWDRGEQAEVRRFHGGRSRVVYRGTGGALTDRKLDNRERYRYVVTLIDQAGNRSTDRAGAVPTRSKLLTPSANQVLANPPHLRWRAVKRASYYNVQLFRGRRKVLSRWPAANELELERRWRFRGERRRLSPGRYCWFVWPGVGAVSKRDYGKRLGKSCFRIAQP